MEIYVGAKIKTFLHDKNRHSWFMGVIFFSWYTQKHTHTFVFPVFILISFN